MKLDPETLDATVEQLQAVVDGACHHLLDGEGHRALSAAVTTLGELARMLANEHVKVNQLRRMLLVPATTEKTRVVLERAGAVPKAEPKPEADKKTRKGTGASRRGGSSGDPRSSKTSNAKYLGACRRTLRK